MNELRLSRTFWLGVAAPLAVAAAAALLTVLTDPYTSTDAQIFYTLPAAFIAGSTFLAGISLVERGGILLGWSAVALSIVGFVLLANAIWESGLSDSDSLWIGLITLIGALVAVTARLLAHAPATVGLGTASGVLAAVAGVVSLDAALSNDQFWRVGDVITALWILVLLCLFLVPVLERAIARSDVWLVAAAMLVAAAVVGVVAVVRGEFERDGYSIFFTVVAAGLAGSALVAALVLVERQRSLLGWAALAAAPLGFVMIVDGIWRESDDRFSWIWTGALVLAALLVAVSARVLAHPGRPVLLASAAGVAAAAAAALSILAIWRDDPSLTLGRTSTASWIVAVLGFLLVPVLAHLGEEHVVATEARP